MYGAERWILGLVRNLDPCLVRSIVGVIRDSNTAGTAPLCVHAEQLGIETLHIDAPGRLSRAAVGKLRILMAQRGIDIVHTHYYKTDIIGALACRGHSAKVLATPHGWSARDAGLKLKTYELLNRFAFYLCDYIVPLSQKLYDELSRWPWLDDRLRLIVNGVDLSEVDQAIAGAANMDDTANSAFTVGYIGRLVGLKRIDTLLHAFDRLEVRSKRLLIIGDGPDRAELEGLAASLPSSADIEFLGYREDRLNLLAGMDAFVLPSASEGIPRCLMEAMAASIPVVASDIAGCRALVSAETGSLFPVGSEAVLSERLAAISANPDVAKQAAVRGREFIVETFSAARMAAEYCVLYQQASANRLPNARQLA